MHLFCNQDRTQKRTIALSQNMPNSDNPALTRHESGGGLDLKIFIKDVHDAHGRKRPLAVRPWSTVKDVKDMLSKHLHVPSSSQYLYFGSGTRGGHGSSGNSILKRRELPNRWTLVDAGIYRSGETILLEIKGAHSCAASITSLRTQSNDVCISSEFLDLAPKTLRRLVQQARRGLALGLKPLIAPDGSGGSYFLSDARKIRVGVFKPADEEPFAANNPRGYVPDSSASGEEKGSLRRGIRPGDSCLREVAAFLLDRDGFSSVPMTTLAECRHPALHINGAQPWNGLSAVGGSSDPAAGKKVGSFQEYAHAECSMDDLGPSKISVDEVHKIAILDIRIMNADRNAANVLCRRIPEDPDHFHLVPIDHGFSLRAACDVAWFDWCWLDWPQLKQPLSKKSRDYVMGLDVEADARLLRERLDFDDDVLDFFRASCNVLKAGVKAGLTLHDIASGILCRNDGLGEVPSKLETMTSMAHELALSAVNNGRFHHATASLALAEQLFTPADHRPPQSFGLWPSSKHHTPSSFAKSAPIVKSNSTFTFPTLANIGDGESAFTDDLSSARTSSDWAKVPLLAHSSTSECGSSTGGDEVSRPTSPCTDTMSDKMQSRGKRAVIAEEDLEADEWAAELIAFTDESMDKKDASLLINTRGRSTSVCSWGSDSSGNLSTSSPVGFWHVRPGSLRVGDDDDQDTTSDDDWTPSLASSFVVKVALPEDSGGVSCNTVIEPSDVVLHRSEGYSTKCIETLDKSLQPPSSRLCGVGFDDDEEVDCDDFPATPSVQLIGTLPFSSNGKTKSNNSNVTPTTTEPIPQKPLMRSISFSAFSSNTNDSSLLANGGVCANKNADHMKVHRPSVTSSRKESDHYRMYFMKFIDLLVMRETERIVHKNNTDVFC